MVGKNVLFVLSAAVLVQTAYSQCLGSTNGIINQNNGINNLAARGINYGSNGINFGSSGINFGANGINFGSNGNINAGQRAGLQNGIINQYGSFDVISGSPAYAEYPSGIQVATEDVEIGGQVAVNGAMPFLGSVAVDGSLPIGGQAALSYAAGPGVSLNGGGCKGLSGGDIGISSNLLGGNLLNGGIAPASFGVGVGNNFLSRQNLPCNKL